MTFSGDPDYMNLKYYFVGRFMNYVFYPIGFFLVFFLQNGRTDCFGNTGPESFYAEMIPLRPRDAISGSEFARRTSGMTGAERQQAALTELRRGNIPEFLRNLKPVRLNYATADKNEINAVIWVMPDYLAIGSNEDFLRIPLNYNTAIKIANEWGFILPTKKIVDAVYEQSTCHLEPDPLPPGPKMRSS
jgi:hypothetical protein